MSGPRCPGQDTRYWGPDAAVEAACRACGMSVELWKDEPRRRCPGCGAVVRNPKVDMGCAVWCTFAGACFGYVPGGSGAEESTIGRLIAAMRSAARGDAARIARALAILSHAEALLAAGGAPPLVVMAAAVLYELGPEAALLIAEEAGIDGPTARRVAAIISAAGRRGDGRGEASEGEEAETPELKMVRDAVLLATKSRRERKNGAGKKRTRG